MQLNEPVDFNRHEVIADPYSSLAHLRAGSDLQWNDSLNAWCLYRYHPVRQVLLDPRFSSDRISPFVRHAGARNADIRYLGECIGLWMVFNDPPSHTRLRNLVNKAFLPAAIEALRPTIREQVDELLAAIKRMPTGADFVRDFAGPLPANVIASMLGVPADDVAMIKEWSEKLARFVLTSRIDADKYAPAAAALASMNEYFDALIARRRADPGDRIIDRLIAAHDGDDLLSPAELLASCVLLMFAGHETTTFFFANGYRALAAHPEAWHALQAGARDAAYVRNAVNEMLRWDGPSLALSRVAGATVEVDGHALKKGERVFVFIAAANRDEGVFERSEEFDIERPDARRMITFGQGIHACLGMHLAWLEGEVAWPRVVEELAGWRLDPSRVTYNGNLVVRGVTALPIAPHESTFGSFGS